MAFVGFALFAVILAYIAGFYDGLRGRAPGPMRGNYEHTEDKDDVDYDDVS